MTTTLTEKQPMTEAQERRLAEMDRRLAVLNGHSNDPINAIRHYARDQFAGKRFPGRKNEDWKYTQVKPVFSRDYQRVLDRPEVERLDHDKVDAYIVRIVDGHVTATEGSLPEGVFAGTWEEAWASNAYGPLAHKASDKMLQEDLAIFEAMALGLADSIIFIGVAKNAVIDKPIRIVHDNRRADAANEVESFTIVSLGTNSSVKLIESYSGEPGTGYFMNTGTHVFVDKGANCTHYRLQTEAYDAFHIAHTGVTQERDSTYGMYVAEFGGKLVRHNIHIEHKDENITSNIYGTFIAQDRQHIDTQSFIDHAKPNCQSNELYKGIVMDYGRGVFNGKIIVRPDAQKTNAFQQNSALVLSPNATMDSKPQLEIFADDVKCSHGATIGQLDPEALFYLKSRGLSDIAAKSMLKKAFLEDVIIQFPDKNILELFEAALALEMDAIADKINAQS